jgi:hypothetical protein
MNRCMKYIAMKYDIGETNEAFSKKELTVAADLRALSSVLNEFGVTFWLTSGTLLGCISRGSILPMDRDVDLGMWDRDRPKLEEALVQLKELGFRLTKRYDPSGDCVKGMVTLIRGGVPIDIKVYKRCGDFMVRGIHKSHSRCSQKVWDLIDLLYFASDYSSLMHRRTHIMRLYGFVSRFASIVPCCLRQSLIEGLCVIWRRLDVTYGQEVLPLKYASSLKETTFYDVEVNVFTLHNDYLDEEYGPGWDQHNPNGKGGTDKFSHILFDEETLEQALVNKELMERCRAVGYID